MGANGNGNEQEPQTIETNAWEKKAKDLFNAFKSPNYSFDEIKRIRDDIFSKHIELKVQEYINSQLNDTSIPALDKRNYAIIQEFLNDYQKIINTAQAATKPIETQAQNLWETTIDASYITFPTTLETTTLVNTIKQAINTRKDPIFTKLFHEFKNMDPKKDKFQIQDQVRKIQEYLNMANNPNPKLAEDGKFWPQTSNELQYITEKKESDITANQANPPENIDINSINFNGLRLSGWAGSERITGDNVKDACMNIPNNIAKQEVLQCLKNNRIADLQKYLNRLLNPITAPTAWQPTIDKQKFHANIWGKSKVIKDTDTWDWTDYIRPDWRLWPQTWIALRSIETVPAIDPLETDKWKQIAIKEQIQQALADDYTEENVTVDLNTQTVSIKFETTENWNKSNTLVYKYDTWEITFKDWDNKSEALKLEEQLKINDLKQSLQPDGNKFQLFAELGQLFATARAKQGKKNFYCKYDTNSKEIKVCTLKADTTNNTFTEESETADLFDNDNSDKDPLTTLDGTYFPGTPTFATEETQTAIAKFMTASQLLGMDETKKTQLNDFLKDKTYKSEEPVT